MIEDSPIAGEVTKEIVLDICLKEKPKRVLEWGGGQGTLTQIVLAYTRAEIDIYEPLPEFREVLKEKFKKQGALQKKRIRIYDSYRELPEERKYDLFIVDGGKNQWDKSFFKAVAAHLISLDSIKTIVIEGQRKLQRYWATEALAMNYIYKPTVYKPHDGMKGALKLECHKSTSRIKKLLNHLYYKDKIY